MIVEVFLAAIYTLGALTINITRDCKPHKHTPQNPNQTYHQLSFPCAESQKRPQPFLYHPSGNWNGGEWKEGEVLTDWLKYLTVAKFITIYDNVMTLQGLLLWSLKVMWGPET